MIHETDYYQMGEIMTPDLREIPVLLDGISWGHEIVRQIPGIEALLEQAEEQIVTPPFDKPTIFNLLAISGVGKDIAEDQIRWIFQHSKRIKALEKRLGRIPIKSVPFWACVLAAQTTTDPDLKIDKTVKQGQEVVATRPLKPFEYVRVSKLQLRVVEYGVRQLEGPRMLLVQPSSPSGWFDKSGSFQVENDRGDSVSHWLASYSKLNPVFYLALTSEARDLGCEVEYRKALRGATANNILSLLATYKKTVHIKTADRGLKNQVFSREELEKLVYSLQNITASPESVLRSHADQRQVIERLYQAGLIHGYSEYNYYEHLRANWDIPQTHFLVSPNQEVDEKTPRHIFAEGGFCADNLVVDLYPQLRDYIL